MKNCKTCKTRTECQAGDFTYRACRMKHAFPTAYKEVGGVVHF